MEYYSMDITPWKQEVKKKKKKRTEVLKKHDFSSWSWLQDVETLAHLKFS